MRFYHCMRATNDTGQLVGSMEPHSLERASEYLNNLLLARGLLSNAKPIDFARPDRNGRGTDATMSRIINLVHDLVLRRDQDSEQRELLAMNIRKVRADETQRVLDLQKLHDKNVELVRSAATAESQERALKTAVRKAEAQAKELKEQMLKMKSTLDQVRAKCVSDVRKRDAELDKLKMHLAGMQRGKKESGGMKINVINFEPGMAGREMRNGQDVDSSQWSLEKETNDFLAALVNETSLENVSLRRIITDTMEILRDLTGLEQTPVDEEETTEKGAEEDGIGIPGQYRKSRQKESSQPDSLVSCTVLAEHMSAILEHCQSILKDPSFVPLEEVQIRDEEIVKLRDGWEKMASRWKEAITMMDSWRRRTSDNGRGFLAVTDLSRLEFGKSIALLPNGQPVFGTDDELSSILYEAGNAEDEAEEEIPDERHVFIPNHHMSMDADDDAEQGEAHQESDLEIPPEPTPKRRGSPARRAGENLGRPVRPLRSINHNINLNPSPSRTEPSPGQVGRTNLDGAYDGIENEPEEWDGESEARSARKVRTAPSFIPVCVPK